MAKKLSPKSIRKLMAENSAKYDAALRRSLKADVSYNEQWAKIQAQCSHKNKRRVMGTPYDSSYEVCEDCGLEL